MGLTTTINYYCCDSTKLASGEGTRALKALAVTLKRPRATSSVQAKASALCLSNSARECYIRHPQSQRFYRQNIVGFIGTPC